MTYFEEKRRRITSQKHVRGVLTSKETTETHIQLEACAGLPINKLELKGNSFQQTYEGRNKFNVDEWVNLLLAEPSLTGEVVEFDGRRCFKLVNASSKGVYYTFTDPNIQRIRFDAYISGTDLPNTSFGQVIYSDNTITYFITGTRDSWKEYSYYKADNTINRFGIYFNNTSTQTVIYIDLDSIMAEDSSTPTAYEPYVGGNASPSLSFPQEILSANNSSRTVYYSNAIKELLSKDTNYYSGSVTGVYMVKLPDEIIGQDITFSTDGETEKYCVGLIDSTNWLFGNSIELASPSGCKKITTKDYTYIYITGALGTAEAIEFFSTYNLYAKTVDEGENFILQLSGVNLFDISQPKFTGNSDIISKTDNSITIKQTSTGQYTSCNIALPIDGKDLLGKKVTIKAKCSQTDSLPKGGIRLQFVQSSSLTAGTMYALATMPAGATEGELKATGTISDLPDFEAYPTAKLCLLLYSNTSGTGSTTTEITYSDIMVSLEDIPYEPYVEPQTVEIPKEIGLDGTIVPLNFAKVDDVADTLIVDNVSKKVIYQQKIYGAEITPSFSIVSWYNLNSSIDGLSHGVSVWSSKYVPQTCSRQKGYCTHGPVQAGWQAKSGDIIVGVNSYAIYFMGLMDIIGVTADWADRTNPTTEEKNAGRQACVDWFAENKPYLEFVLPTPIEYDLTNTNLGQQLLGLAMPYRASLFVATSSNLATSKMSVDYYSMEAENKLCLTVNCISMMGDQLRSEEHHIRAGSRYVLNSPVIDGYMPVQEKQEGLIRENTTLTITYKET